MLPNVRMMHVVIILGVIIIAAVFIAKFGFGMDLISPSSGEMAIAKPRPVVSPVPTIVQNPVVRQSITIRPQTIPTCTAPTTMCADTCVDTATDPTNCGACGRVCSATYADVRNVAEYGCSNGQCTIASCKSGFGNCINKGPLSTDGGACETNLMTGEIWNVDQGNRVYLAKDTAGKSYIENPSSCGSCGNKCQGGSSYFGICDNGACRQVCWGVWLNCDNSWGNGCEQVWDNNNCGACGAKCPSDSNCNNGCCMKVQYNPSIAQMEEVVVADSFGITCGGNSWNRMSK